MHLFVYLFVFVFLQKAVMLEFEVRNGKCSLEPPESEFRLRGVFHMSLQGNIQKFRGYERTTGCILSSSVNYISG